jgi:catechol 2,3-dioxygenase-like lactoylglutathione lyase family enzyme
LVGDVAFNVVRTRLQALRISYEEGGDAGTERVQHWLRFTDPGGTNIELYRNMHERGIAPNNGVGLEQLLHAGWKTANFTEASEFYQNVLGFRPSDWIEDKAGFFRAANKYHHSAVLVGADRPTFDHFCIQVDSLDDLMRLRSNAQRFGIKLRNDLLRHAPSGSISIYMQDEARQYAVEYCINHPRIEDPDHRPRVLDNALETLDVWSTPLPEPSAITLNVAHDAEPAAL